MTTFSLVETMSGRSDQGLSVVQAAELVGLSRSQVHRLLQAYDRSGAAGLDSKKRSRPSNRRHSEAVSRETCKPSRSASFSAANVGPKSAWRSRMRSSAALRNDCRSLHHRYS
jgi:hypothetical protein